MIRKLFTVLLSAMFLLSSMGMAFAEVPNTAEGKLAAIEITLYGQEQTGPLAERIKRVEEEYEGADSSSSMMNRINYLYNYTYDNSATPSLVTQMNALEWAISHQISAESMVKRVAMMEGIIQGKPSEGTLHSRIEALAQFAFGTAEIPLTQVEVPMNTLARISLLSPINAKNLKVGDVIKYQASEDVIEDNMLIFAKGAYGEGVITKVEQAGNFGRDAKVDAEFKTLTAVDATVMDMNLGQEAQEQMKNMAMAAGASIAGMVLLGPIGIIGGAFVHGKNIDLPEGTEFYIQTSRDTVIYGIPVTAE
ncbi:MAG: hypothetical protein MR853_01290 [Selenomonadales bacterium]|nr:hypothetical protein [Selenomonadales bacterium]